jgi:hypothetical protein
MPLNDASLNTMADAWKAAYPYVAIHTAQPNVDTGTNQSAAGRVAASWGTAANGDLTVTNIDFTGGAASGAATHVGFWSAATSGTFGGYQALTGDQAFNAAGEYTITSLTVDGSSS